MADVTFIVDGKTLTAPAGTLLIDACKSHGIEIPAFCYYPGLSLQAACRMCVVRIEKMPKLQTACTTPVAEGMVVTTESPEIAQARKATLQLLLGNHPLDCPVCDAGGECELQDMTFKYGAADSFYAEPKNHREEQKWSPVVYFDRPRCILCYRCVRMCGEGMDIFALGVQNRGASSVIAPNVPAGISGVAKTAWLAHLDCEQCGMCIDACPVGALTSGTYRYKTRPWEMNHIATVCTHCGDGCKTTLGVRSVSDGTEIVRGDNRDKSGMNGDFLCNKGRYAFDFANNIERLTSPLIRKNGKLAPVSWEEALTFAGTRLRDLRQERGPDSIGVIGSNRTTNEENYLLQKFARTVIGTNNIDHHRTADFVTSRHVSPGEPPAALASQHDVENSPAILLVGGDPTNQAPLTAWNIRTNVRLRKARALHREPRRDQAPPPGQGLRPGLPVRLRRPRDLPRRRRQRALATSTIAQADELSSFREALRAEEKLVVVIGNEAPRRRTRQPHQVRSSPTPSSPCSPTTPTPAAPPTWASSPTSSPATSPSPASHARRRVQRPRHARPRPPRHVRRRSRRQPLRPLRRRLQPHQALRHRPRHAQVNTFLIVQDLFLTETAALADVSLPRRQPLREVRLRHQQLRRPPARQQSRRPAPAPAPTSSSSFASPATWATTSKPSSPSAKVSAPTSARPAARSPAKPTATPSGSPPTTSSPSSAPSIPSPSSTRSSASSPATTSSSASSSSAATTSTSPPPPSGLVQITAARKDLVLPSADTLFTSGSLTRYSPMLQDVQRHQSTEVADHLASAD